VRALKELALHRYDVSEKRERENVREDAAQPPPTVVQTLARFFFNEGTSPKRCRAPG